MSISLGTAEAVRSEAVRSDAVAFPLPGSHNTRQTTLLKMPSQSRSEVFMAAW
jgi:hypothetical protein